MERYIKYPRTYHLPYSLTVTGDDKRFQSDEQFKLFDQVYCTEKLDGENTTVYSDGYIHARSINGNHYMWQSWLKQYIQSWYKDIPTGWRVCGENLYGKHSIGYTFSDESYFFQVFGIYNEKNERLSLNDMIDWCTMLGLHFVPIFYIGKYDKDLILEKFNQLQSDNFDKFRNETEGFVVSNTQSFLYEDFSKNVGKFVRANHVTTDNHWSENWVCNKIDKNILT